MKSYLRNNRGIDRSGPKSDILKNNLNHDSAWQFCEQWLFSEIHEQYQKDSIMRGYLGTLHACLETIEYSPTGRMLLKEVLEEGWSVGLADLPENEFTISIPDKLLTLDNHALAPEALFKSDHFFHMTLINMIRALRDIGHETRHGGFDEDYGPEDVLMLERMRAADCNAIAAQAGWELRSAGIPEVWRSMIGSEEGDIALSYSTYMENNPLHSFNKKALAAAFHQWFACEDRINACDHATLEYLDYVLHNTNEQSPFGRHRLNGSGIEMMSCLPDRTAYLQGQGERILRDPAYAGLDDEYNQSHFMQLMHDLQAVIVSGVPFRDETLAKRLFPAEFTKPRREKV